MTQIGRFFSIIGCSLILASCSIIDFAYNNAPAFVGSEFEDAFDLDEAQSAQLDSRLQQFFSWHRKQELARYRQLLQQSAAATARGITADEFLYLQNEIREAWRRSLAMAIDNLGDLATTLDERQIEHYQSYFREASEEYEDYLEKTLQQREIYRVEQNLERLEDWFGDFDIFLEDRVRARLQQVPDLYEPWFRYREARHHAMIDALIDASQTGITIQKLKYVFLDPDTEYARRFEPARQAYWQGYAAALEDISSWLSKRQRRNAADRLEGYARLAASLGDQG